MKSSKECLRPSPVLLLLLPVRLSLTRAFTHTHLHPHPYAHTTPMPPGTAESERCVLRCGCGSVGAKVLVVAGLASIVVVLSETGVVGGGGGGWDGDCCGVGSGICCVVSMVKFSCVGLCMVVSSTVVVVEVVVVVAMVVVVVVGSVQGFSTVVRVTVVVDALERVDEEVAVTDRYFA